MSFDKALWDLFLDVESNAVACSQKAQEICIEYLGPAWKGEDFILTKLSGGMTNLVFSCKNSKETVLFRIQCNKDVMQLQNEVAVFLTLAHHGLGPKLLGIFPGGRLEEFIPCRTVSYAESASPNFVQHIAAAMARVHQVEVPLARNAQMVPIMRKWLARIERNGGKDFNLYSKNAGIPADKFPANVTLADLEREVSRVEEHMAKVNSPVQLTHNDLFAGNILLKDGFEIDKDGIVWKTTEEGKVKTDEPALVLIDFEFGFYNYRGFDIGNFMCEMGNTYFAEMPTYTNDLACWKDTELHRCYCIAYMKETYQLVPKEKLGALKFTGDLDRDVEFLLEEAEGFMSITGLWWGLWNIICVQEGIPGMDFESGFRDRLACYFYLKKF